MPCCWFSCLARRLRKGTVRAVILSAGVAALGSTPALAVDAPQDEAASRPSRSVQVGVVLVVAHPISTTAITTMQGEAERIWSRYGVGIAWRSPGLVDTGHDLVVVLSDQSRPCGTSRSNRNHTFGCLVYGGSSAPLIRIFADRARRTVEIHGARLCDPFQEGLLEHLTAMLLGRVLAHELGHFLLGPVHSAAGLMRSRIPPGDLLTPGRDAFSLTEAQIADLQQTPARATRAKR